MCVTTPFLGSSVVKVPFTRNSTCLPYLSVHENRDVREIGFARRCGRHFVRSAHTAARSVSQGIRRYFSFTTRRRCRRERAVVVAPRPPVHRPRPCRVAGHPARDRQDEARGPQRRAQARRRVRPSAPSRTSPTSRSSAPSRCAATSRTRPSAPRAGATARARVAAAPTGSTPTPPTPRSARASASPRTPGRRVA